MRNEPPHFQGSGSCTAPCQIVRKDASMVDNCMVTVGSILFYKNILRTSAVSSTNFGSLLTFASCVVGTF